MSIGLIGTKIGMTREFMESGQSVPVTVIKTPISENDNKRINTFLEYLMRLDDPAGCLYILKNFFDTSDLLEYVSSKRLNYTD